jgi:hypothetical protein
MDRRGSKLRSMGFFNISIKFLIDRIQSWNFGTLAGLESKPQVQMTIKFKFKTILALRPFQRVLICPNSSWVGKDGFFFVRVIVKYKFSDSKATNLKY